MTALEATKLRLYLAEKRMHIDRIQHLDKTGDLEGLDDAMRKYAVFLADWKRKGIHNIK